MMNFLKIYLRMHLNQAETQTIDLRFVRIIIK